MYPPPEEHQTPAARRAAALARSAIYAHFEHHVLPPAPAAWIPARPDLGQISGWSRGHLPETKFRHFRLDRLIASYHPAHEARWSAHELCHHLVGFAYRPGARLLDTACAARAAEALPVTLWYFFDRPDAPPEERPHLRAQGLRFLDREIAAVQRTARQGWPEPAPWWGIDLCSDSLAWAAAHHPRLSSPAFARHAARLHPDHTGLHPSLDALLDRLIAARDALLSGDPDDPRPACPLPPWRSSPAGWMIRDLAWRLASAQAALHDRPGPAADAARAFDPPLDRLAAASQADAARLAARADLADPQSLTDLAAVLADLDRLCRDLPADLGLSFEDLAAVGYDLPALPDGRRPGRSPRQIRAGIKSACPGALRLLRRCGEPAVDALIRAFAHADTCVRQPVGRRFARYLSAALPDDPATELASLEAAICYAPPADPAVEALRHDTGFARALPAPDCRLIRVRHDWSAWIADRLPRDPQLSPCPPHTLALRRDAAGEVQITALPDDLLSPDGLSVAAADPDDQAALIEAGVLRGAA